MNVLKFVIVIAHTVGCSFAYRLPRLNNNFVRECEFKHARVAIVAAPTLAVMNVVGIDEPVRWLSEQPVDTQLTFFSSAALVEATSLARLGPDFTLKKGLEPGNYFSNKTVDADLELISGRYFMLASAGIMAAALMHA